MEQISEYFVNKKKAKNVQFPVYNSVLGVLFPGVGETSFHVLQFMMLLFFFNLSIYLYFYIFLILIKKNNLY